MAWAMVGVAVVGAGVKMYQANQNRKAAEKAAKKAEQKQLAQQAKLDKEKAKYSQLQFENPYENVENVYEDLTVNQQQAQFEAQQGQQQRANIMQGLKGAAGSSGIAALAQTMANQGQLQAQKASASIGQQEAANQKLAAQGAQAVQAAEAKGKQMQQEFEIGKQETLLGMEMAAAAGANTTAQQAELNKQQADAASRAAVAEGIGDVAGAAAGGIGSGSFSRKGNPELSSEGTQESLISDQGDWWEKKYGGEVESTGQWTVND